ncbi:MAG: sulfatase-like hydrolase/transferase, partial [Planctomycetota bacterium]|nr:sulfatase-like hydrolase/transferase [Planctomycetota bacterium]
MFSSDNGPTFNGGTDSTFFESTDGLRGLKCSVYEGGLRVPMIARWPGKIRPGSTTDHLSAFWDVLPTIAEIAGVKAPGGIDGISFAPTLLGRAAEQEQHEYLYWEFRGYGGQQAVRMGPWKAVRQDMLQRRNPTPLRIFLYNLETDVGETTDVAGRHPDIVERVRRIMKDARTPSELFPLPPLAGRQ